MSDVLSVCANCGKGEGESGNLKSCTACKLVKYCSRDCQIAHRPQHKKECRKRAAELHDEKLFTQPTAEDCPICFLRIPSLGSGSIYQSCCGKVICCGCFYAPLYDNQGNRVDDDKQNECAFCRVVAPKSNEEAVERLKKRFEVGDPIATFNLGVCCRDGTYGYPQDHNKALEFWHRAGELGCSMAYGSIGYAYERGEGVEVDKKKAIHYYEQAAMGGNVRARYNLGRLDFRRGIFYIGRALKHYMIAVRGGHNESLKEIQQLYSNGFAGKEDYMKALQLYQEYFGEIQSTQRDKAAAAYADGENRYY